MKKAYSINTKISSFVDPLQFLGTVVQELRDQGVFSHRKFNQDCGFSSPNFIQLVIQGKRNLSDEAAIKVGKTLGLSPDEIKLFLKMLKLNSQGDPAQKMQFLEELLRDPLLMKVHHLSAVQMAYYKYWYNIPIREILGQYPEITNERLAEVLIPKISVQEVEQSLKILQELELIEKTPEGWRTLHGKVFLANDIVHQSLRHYHRVMLNLASESIERFAAAEREISCVTFRLTAAEFALLKERIRAFKKEVLAGETQSPESAVYQFNFQLFPLSQIIEEKES